MLRSKMLAAGLALYAVLLFVFILYVQGTPGIFLVDDTYNLEALNLYGGVTDWNSFKAFVFGNTSGMFGRSLSMLSFLINDQYYPGSVESYRYTNIMIHLMCGVLLFALVQQLLDFKGRGAKDAVWLALIASFWWMILPINVSTTLYIIQRMTQLSTLFSLLGLVGFLYGRRLCDRNIFRGLTVVFFSLYGFGLLAVLSKESGALIFLYALSCELFLRYSGVKQHKEVWGLILAPVLLGGGYFIYKWGAFTGSTYRDFDLLERVLTEVRILWMYVYKIFVPSLSGMGLIHDDIVVSRGFFQPASTFLALLGHIFVLGVAFLLRKKYPMLVLGVSWYYLGHSMESTVIPLELYFEHRNYMPSMMLLVVAVVFIWDLGCSKQLARTLLLFLVVISSIVCAQRVLLWGKPVKMIEVWSVEHPDSVRAQTMYVRALSGGGQYEEATLKIMELRERWPAAIHYDLLLVDFYCSGYTDKYFSDEGLLAKYEKAEYFGSLPSIVENVYSHYLGDTCDAVDAAFMHALFEGIKNYKNVISPVKAKVSFWNAEVYERERDFGGTIRALDETFKYQKSSFILFKKAMIFMSAGLDYYALEEVDKAIELEMKKTGFKRQMIADYQTLKILLEKRLENGRS